MSPLIHAEIGWLIAQPLQKRRDRVLVVAAAVLPDLDGAGLLVSDALYEAWHHRLAHGLIAAAVISIGVGLWTRRPLGLVLGVLAFHSHIVMDLVGSGPGWPILYWWPWSNSEWLPSWQWDLASWQNSVFGMFATLACLACAIPLGRTPVEVVSPKADTRVVQTLRARFSPRRSAHGGRAAP
jgi:inner membrane protein